MDCALCMSRGFGILCAVRSALEERTSYVELGRTAGGAPVLCGGSEHWRERGSGDFQPRAEPGEPAAVGDGDESRRCVVISGFYHAHGRRSGGLFCAAQRCAKGAGAREVREAADDISADGGGRSGGGAGGGEQ